MIRPISDVLQKTPQVPQKAGEIKGEKVTPDVERVSLFELEAMFRNNTIVFNSTNKIVQTLMSSPHRLKGPKKSVEKFFNRFLANIGRIGNRLTWSKLKARIFQDQIIYGWAFVQNIRDNKKIVDFDIMDAKRMDYLKDLGATIQADPDPRNNNGKIILDKFGMPVGFTQTIGTDLLFSEPKNKGLPKEINRYVHSNQHFFFPEEISLFKLYTVGDGFYPIGLVEPAYTNSIQKLNMQESITQALLRHGAPILLAKVGDQNHEPTPTQINNILNKLKDLNSKSELAVPYYYDVDFLESNIASEMTNHLSHYEDNEITAMGIPKPYAKGSGEATNRSTLTNQDNLFRLSLQDLVRRTCEDMRQQMFIPLARSYGIKEEDVPCIEWEIVGVEEISRKVDRVLSYVEKGLLSAEDAMNLIKKIDSIDEEDLR